jgi:hypothetical protein
LAGGFHSLADGGGRFAQSVAGKFFIVHARYFYMNVDAV